MADLFDFDPSPKKFTVMGNPVNHSLSPAIHTAFGTQIGVHLHYTITPVDVGGFVQAVDAFRAADGIGLNVTVPFKRDAWRYANRLSERARLAQAVNTLGFDESGDAWGDNTDGVGMVRDICNNLSRPLQGSRILILGAGGAVRGVLGPILDELPDEVVIANRTPNRAASLVQQLELSGRVHAGGYEIVAGQCFDIVINGTAASLEGALPPLLGTPFNAGALAYDMMYGARATPFLNWCQQQGAHTCSDGLGMLVEQAAEAFRLWHGQLPDTSTVLKALRESA